LEVLKALATGLQSLKMAEKFGAQVDVAVLFQALENFGVVWPAKVT
jgi:hypothetical protein